MSRNRIQLLLMFVIVGIGFWACAAFVFSWFQGEERRHYLESMTRPQEKESIPITQSSRDRTLPIVRKVDRAKSWSRFRGKFGESLKPTYLDDGTLASIRGESTGERRGVEGFDPKNSRGAIARAEEILKEAEALLGVDERFPLSEPKVRTSPFSAQVYFRETYEGVPLAPHGHVSVDLGKEGELLGLYSNYVSPVEVTNQMKLSRMDAFKRAERATKGKRVEGGQRIIWVNRARAKSGKKVSGRYAYDTMVEGIQIVVDAETGEILHRRSRRNY